MNARASTLPFGLIVTADIGRLIRKGWLRNIPKIVDSRRHSRVIRCIRDKFTEQVDRHFYCKIGEAIFCTDFNFLYSESMFEILEFDTMRPVVRHAPFHG